MQELTLKQLYIELDVDPDLRRLGKYKVVLKGTRPIFAVDVNLEGKDVYLGEGDFTEAFTAFCDTKARSLDFGNSKFTDLYLDNLKVESLRFSDSRTSRLYFDAAEIKNCEFGRLFCPEMYFDLAQIDEVYMQELRSDLLNLDDAKVKKVIAEAELDKTYRFATRDGIGSFGDFVIGENSVKSETSGDKSRELTVAEFIDELRNNSDLRRLGKYTVIPDGAHESILVNEISGMQINFGEGDLSFASVVLGDLSVVSINLDQSIFSELNLGNSETERLDFSRSQVGWLSFASAKIGRCFFAQAEVHRLDGHSAGIGYLYGENARLGRIEMDKMKVDQFDVNDMEVGELRLGKSEIREMYMSRGKIQKMYCDESELQILNLHESKLDELHFDKSKIRHALINKSSIKETFCDDLEAEILYIGYHESELGSVDFGEMKKVKNIEVNKLLAENAKPDGVRKKEHVFRRLSFGPDTPGSMPEGERQSLEYRRMQLDKLPRRQWEDLERRPRDGRLH